MKAYLFAASILSLLIAAPHAWSERFVPIATEPAYYLGKVCGGLQCSGAAGCVSCFGYTFRDTYSPSGLGCASTPGGSGSCDQTHRPCHKSEAFGFNAHCTTTPNSVTVDSLNGC